MKPRTPLHQKRWTLRLFEWGVLAFLLLILLGVFLRRVEHLQAEVERLHVQAVVENLRAVVLLTGILHRDKAAARQGGNPVALLEDETGLKPPGYLGELDCPDPGEIAPGHWYFDVGQGALVYRVRSAAGFAGTLPGPTRLRLCIRNAAADKSSGPSLQLEACEPYRWKGDK